MQTRAPQGASPLSLSDAKQGFEKKIEALVSQQRCDEACQAILARYGAELLAFLTRSMLDPSLAEDLYQDLAVALLEGLPSFGRRSSVRTWTYAIAHHLIKQWRRRYSRRHVERLDTDRAREHQNPNSISPTADLVRDEVGKLLAQLGVTDREVLVLRTEQDLNYAEIGEVLGISEESAKKRFQRARARLQQLVSGQPV